jgi:hypothetical protein
MAYESLPIDDAIRAVEEAKKGNWAGVAKNVGLGAIDTLALGTGVGFAANVAKKQGVKLASKQGAKVIAKGLASPRFAANQAKTRTGRAVTYFSHPLNPAVVGSRVAASQLGGPGQAPATAGGRTPSAADFRMFEESQKTPGTATGNPADRGPGIVPTNKAGTIGGPGSPGTRPGNVGLVGLTPDQIEQIGMDRLAAERAYEELLAEQTLRKQQAQRGYTQEVQGLQRQAAGSAEDLAGQLSAAGLDISPVSAFGAEQMTQAPLVAGSQAARGSLDKYLAELAAQQTQASAAKDQALMNINAQKKRYQILNTLAQQQGAYGRMGGY